MSYTAPHKRRVTIAEAKRRAHYLEAGMVLGLLLLFVEVLKQSPPWLLFLTALAALLAVTLVVEHWTVFAVAGAVYVAWRIVKGVLRWRRERAEIPF